MSVGKRNTGQGGYALLVTLLVILAVSSLSLGAVLMGGNARMVNVYEERQSDMEGAAEAGIEEARARLNADKSLYPKTGYRVLENGVPVADANGTRIPNVKRYTYAGPRGVTTGQYGIFGSIVVVIEDATGNRVIRRGDVMQESFAKFAYFTDKEDSNVWFAGDVLWGPVHSNDRLGIWPTGAEFHELVTTAKTFRNGSARYGTFHKGYQENVAKIPLPDVKELDELRNLAAQGGTALNTSNGGDDGEAQLRIEFVTLTLSGQEEGFFRVYESDKPEWVVASPTSDLTDSHNCGNIDSDGKFRSAASYKQAQNSVAAVAALKSASKRCYPGGADELTNGHQASDVPGGTWIAWSGDWSDPWWDELKTLRPTDYKTFFPLKHTRNPNFKGVIHVNGKVAVSGRLHGQVTLAAEDEIIVIDDLEYATKRGGRVACKDSDMLGLFTEEMILIANNAINAPQKPASGENWQTYDDSPDEYVDAVLLTLDRHEVEEYREGAVNFETCNGLKVGRGCLIYTGGMIAKENPIHMAFASWTPTFYGHLPLSSYDECAGTNPPPYFPTTGRFTRVRTFEVDPVGFDLDLHFGDVAARN